MSRLGLTELYEKRQAEKLARSQSKPAPTDEGKAEPTKQEPTEPKDPKPSRPKQALTRTPKKIKAKPIHPNKSSSVSTRPLPQKSAPFEQRYKRITTYLENRTFEKVQQLHQRGEIDKITNLINAAVKEFLNKYY